MGPRADTKFIDRGGQLKLTEKLARHTIIVVLARVQKHFMMRSTQSPAEYRGFDELRPRTYD